MWILTDTRMLDFATGRLLLLISLHFLMCFYPYSSLQLVQKVQLLLREPLLLRPQCRGNIAVPRVSAVTVARRCARLPGGYCGCDPPPPRRTPVLQ